MLVRGSQRAEGRHIVFRDAEVEEGYLLYQISEQRKVGEVSKGQGRRGAGEFPLKRSRIEACKSVGLSIEVFIQILEWRKRIWC